VALTFVLATLPVVPEGWALLGAATGPLPFGRCVALETSNVFIALVGGDVAVFAVRVRFFQRQGYDAEAAVSAGSIATTASWTVKGLLSSSLSRSPPVPSRPRRVPVATPLRSGSSSRSSSPPGSTPH